MKSTPLTILLGGKISSVPFQGGWTWVILQYLLGLKRLGHEVYFVEGLDKDSLSPPDASLDDSINAAYFRHVMTEFGLAANSALILQGTDETVGRSYADIEAIARHASVLLNISGTLVDPRLTDSIPIRVYIDLDPAFTQLWREVDQIDMHFTGSTHFATVGMAIGTTECSVPTCGVEWIPMRQPVALAHWAQTAGILYDALTTVANWRGYGSIAHDGVFYGQKAHSLRQFTALPTMTSEKFTLALSIHPDEQRDLDALTVNGWRILNPDRVVPTPSLYRQFIQSSKAEFGIAKSGYVLSKCGWFSDRSTCYLASGRPVIAQDTGFSRFLPVGEGLFAFQTPDDVLTAIDALRTDYGRHSRAARAIAADYFDSDKVLHQLLERVGALEYSAC
jgi:hypothetical protein